ncbi:alcohol dehydrogenase catalytic domain-containing protein [Frankia sp. AvcI1]|uniref:alcohol dehydrogenase catalytic domain-containing protein n=1 Tax=Frankia sp. AvcI1 TaxID=573496 RepID=UPI002118A02A|nr:zinc-binding dehydrogenase [Frankia sp. AvcI1]
MSVGIASAVGTFTTAELETIPPGPHDVVVAVGASGICASDHSVLAGHLPFGLPLVLGHELAGRVVEVGTDVSRVRVGDRVVGASIPACGRCWWCRRHLKYLCAQTPAIWAAPRYRTDGGHAVSAFCGLGSFAETTTVHELSVVPVGTDLPDEQLALIGCGVVTGAGAVFNTARVSPGDEIAVVGAGAVGLAVIQAAAIAGASRIVAIEPVPAKRRLAADLGATDVLDPTTTDDVVGTVRDLTAGRGVDAAFEAAGRVDTTLAAYRMTRAAGTVVAVGAAEATAVLALGAWEHVSSGRNFTSAVYGSADIDVDFPLLVRLAEAGRLNLERLVSTRIGLSAADITAAFADTESVRSVILP